MYGTMTAAMQSGAVVSPNYQYNSEMSAIMSLGWGYVLDYAFKAAITADMILDELYAPRYKMTATMTGVTESSTMIRPAMVLEGAMKSAVVISPIIYPATQYTSDMTGDMMINIAIYPQYGVFYSVMTAVIAGTPIREIQMIFDNFVMQPGSSIVIDSENYTVNLDGVNVIDRYDGDWMEFTRLLRGLEVSSGTSGTLAVSILYRERFL
jgi:hypothetical protein